MKMIVGLGNPGEQYAKTRHNVGFVVLDELARKLQIPITNFQTNSKFQAQMIQTNDFLLVKPLTYMNKSGEAVAKLANFYKVKPEEIWVIHDDLDIALGEYKIQLGKGPKVHGGINSIEVSLGTKDFWRARIGVENRAAFEDTKMMRGETYVLEQFLPDEREGVATMIGTIADEIVKGVKNGIV